MLGHAVQAHAMLREKPRHRRHNTRSIRHGEADVIAAAQIFDGNDGQLVNARAANNGPAPQFDMPRDLDNIP